MLPLPHPTVYYLDENNHNSFGRITFIVQKNENLFPRWWIMRRVENRIKIDLNRVRQTNAVRISRKMLVVCDFIFFFLIFVTWFCFNFLYKTPKVSDLDVKEDLYCSSTWRPGYWLPLGWWYILDGRWLWSLMGWC